VLFYLYFTLFFFILLGNAHFFRPFIPVEKKRRDDSIMVLESRLSKKVISILTKNGKKFRIKKLFSNFFFGLNGIILRHFWRFSDDFLETEGSSSSNDSEVADLDKKKSLVKSRFLFNKFERVLRAASLKFKKNSLVFEKGIKTGSSATEYNSAFLKKIDTLLTSKLFFSSSNNSSIGPFLFSEDREEESVISNRALIQASLGNIFLIRYYSEKVFYLYYVELMQYFGVSPDDFPPEKSLV